MIQALASMVMRVNQSSTVEGPRQCCNGGNVVTEKVDKPNIGRSILGRLYQS